MSIKSDADRRGLEAAGAVVRLTLDALAGAVRPGITTAELDAVAAAIFAAHGARSAPVLVYGFPGSVLISVNDEVVHGVPGPRRIARGDVVKLDVTVERDGYMADAARTVVVEGGSGEARRLAACAERAFEAALQVAAGRESVTQDDDGWTLRTRDGSLAAHHEHTLVITRGRPVLLTAA